MTMARARLLWRLWFLHCLSGSQAALPSHNSSTIATGDNFSNCTRADACLSCSAMAQPCAQDGAMRIAWSGVLLHSPHELLRGGMSAFKANWREEQLHRRMVTAAFLAWRDLMDRNKAVAAVRSRILDVSRHIAGSANSLLSFQPQAADLHCSNTNPSQQQVLLMPVAPLFLPQQHTCV